MIIRRRQFIVAAGGTLVVGSPVTLALFIIAVAAYVSTFGGYVIGLSDILALARN